MSTLNELKKLQQAARGSMESYLHHGSNVNVENEAERQKVAGARQKILRSLNRALEVSLAVRRSCISDEVWRRCCEDANRIEDSGSECHIPSTDFQLLLPPLEAAQVLLAVRETHTLLCDFLSNSSGCVISQNDISEAIMHAEEAYIVQRFVAGITRQERAAISSNGTKLDDVTMRQLTVAEQSVGLLSFAKSEMQIGLLLNTAGRLQQSLKRQRAAVGMLQTVIDRSQMPGASSSAVSEARELLPVALYNLGCRLEQVSASETDGDRKRLLQQEAQVIFSQSNELGQSYLDPDHPLKYKLNNRTQDTSTQGRELPQLKSLCVTRAAGHTQSSSSLSHARLATPSPTPRFEITPATSTQSSISGTLPSLRNRDTTLPLLRNHFPDLAHCSYSSMLPPFVEIRRSSFPTIGFIGNYEAAVLEEKAKDISAEKSKIYNCHRLRRPSDALRLGGGNDMDILFSEARKEEEMMKEMRKEIRRQRRKLQRQRSFVPENWRVSELDPEIAAEEEQWKKAQKRKRKKEKKKNEQENEQENDKLAGMKRKLKKASRHGDGHSGEEVDILLGNPLLKKKKDPQIERGNSDGLYGSDRNRSVASGEDGVLSRLLRKSRNAAGDTDGSESGIPLEREAPGGFGERLLMGRLNSTKTDMQEEDASVEGEYKAELCSGFVFGDAEPTSLPILKKRKNKRPPTDDPVNQDERVGKEEKRRRKRKGGGTREGQDGLDRGGGRVGGGGDGDDGDKCFSSRAGGGEEAQPLSPKFLEKLSGDNGTQMRDGRSERTSNNSGSGDDRTCGSTDQRNGSVAGGVDTDAISVEHFDNQESGGAPEEYHGLKVSATSSLALNISANRRKLMKQRQRAEDAKSSDVRPVAGKEVETSDSTDGLVEARSGRDEGQSSDEDTEESEEAEEGTGDESDEDSDDDTDEESDDEEAEEETVEEAKERCETELLIYFKQASLRRTKSACIIQCAWRCSVSRAALKERQQILFWHVYQRQKAATSCIEGFLSSVLARKLLQKWQKLSAAEVERRVSYERRVVDSIVVIAYFVTEALARRRQMVELCKLLRIQNMDELQLRISATTIVSRWWRIVRVRKAYWRRRAKEVAEQRRLKALKEQQDNAATQIQRCVKGYLARCDVKRMIKRLAEEHELRQRRLRESIDLVRLCLQEYTRRCERLAAEAVHRTVRHEEAAAVIQQGWRAALRREAVHNALTRCRRIVRSVLMIQRVYRRFCAGIEIRYLRRVQQVMNQDRLDAEYREYRAIIRLQCFARLVIAKREARHRRAAIGRGFFFAAITIQSASRGGTTRMKLGQALHHRKKFMLLEQERLQCEKEQRIATINAFLRARLSGRMAEDRRCHRLTEKLYMRRRVRRELLREKCATIIQRGTRRWIACRRKREEAERGRAMRALVLTCVVRLQSIIRMFLARRQYRQLRYLYNVEQKKREDMEEVALLLWADEWRAAILQCEHDRRRIESLEAQGRDVLEWCFRKQGLQADAASLVSTNMAMETVDCLRDTDLLPPMYQDDP
ncbi:hypothetical protein TRVL_00775 [Trypanosoma vivax]|nr:hypothetical protein TRVL_00775 [Trypanosoma vivax]